MPRCKLCRNKFEARNLNQKHCFENNECIRAEIELKKSKAWKAKKKVLKEGLKTKQNYESDLEVVFNKWIRLRDADLPCISCDKKAGTYDDSAGHFYPAGTHKNLRFNEDNVHSQCFFDCNKNKHGNLLEYRIRLIERIGIERVEGLDRLRNIPLKLTIPELKKLITEYKQKIKSCKQQ